MDKQQLAVCAVFENEARFLPEWLAYHRVVGVDHFVLYDSASTDDPGQAINASGLAGLVTLVPWPVRPALVTAHQHFIDVYSPGFEWAAFLDLDDFLLPLSSRRVADTLAAFGNAAAVRVHRRIFGPALSEARPRGLLIEDYERRAADDFTALRGVRTIARCTALLDTTQTPHVFDIDGAVLDTAGQPVRNHGEDAPPQFQNLTIHHYTRSHHDWLSKLERTNAMTDPAGPKIEPAAFFMLAEACREPDTAMREFVPAVRRLLGLADAREAPAAAETSVGVPGEPATWRSCGQDAQERIGGLGLVFRDRSRAGTHWIAALRGAAAGLTDPAFLLDEYDRIRNFPTDAEARTACDEALARPTGH